MPTLVITRDNAKQQIQQRLRRLDPTLTNTAPGCLPRRTRYGFSPSVPTSPFFFPRIPRRDWPDLIEKGKGTWLSDLLTPDLPPHDQGSTNYCWAHGCVTAVEILRLYEQQPARILSAESVAVPLTGGRNRGGTPEEALHRLASHGAAAQIFWPPNDRNQNHADPGWEKNALEHRVLTWVDLENFDDQMTLALHRVPVAIGLGWWGHLVCQLDPIQLDSSHFGIGIRNSWGPDWGDNGYGILDEKHGTADLGAFAPISQTFSDT